MIADFFERYFDRISPEPNSGCHLWTGSALPSGYGTLTFEGGSYYAHRCAYECEHGEGSADGLVIRHRCDNPPCVNPDHLLGGTHADNAQDAIRRGRLRPRMGSQHPCAKLDEATVGAMRERAKTTHIEEVVREFGASHGSGAAAIRGDTWRHVPLLDAPTAKWLVPTRYAEKSPRAKFTNREVIEIRARLDAGESGAAIAREFGVCKATISSIKVRRYWSTI